MPHFMSRVGIITYHRAYNYGSALQAFALNYFLRKNNHKVETIDYRTKAQDDIYRIFTPVRSLLDLFRNIQTLFMYRKMTVHKKRFDQFIAEFIPVTEQIETRTELDELNERFDYFVVGSDQVWNARCPDFTDAYLLSFVRDKSKCISYAASIGTNQIIPSLRSNFTKHLTDFQAISMREQQGAVEIETVLGKSVKTVLDPVFLLDRDEWSLVENPNYKLKEPYILCYFIGDIPGMRAIAKEMKARTKLNLVVIFKNLRDYLYPCKKKYDAGPKEFVSLINGAEYVYTNSFHAIAFSLIYHKRFWVYTSPSRCESGSQSRIYNLLETLQLQERIIDHIPTDLDCEIDFPRVDSRINSLKTDSINFLKMNLR